jgi:hypothetical protein
VADATKPDFEQNLVDFRSARFTQLRPGQRQVLATYADQHLDTTDLAIEMPTGEGKTLLALLIADHALTRGWSVAYLTGTRQLAERVEEEAKALGLDVVRFASKDHGGAKLDDYHQAQSVGVMNYWVYFNSNPVPQPADLVIFDDAHLAEQPLSGLQTLRIPDKLGPLASSTGQSANWWWRTPTPTPVCARRWTAPPGPVPLQSCCPSATGTRSRARRATLSRHRLSSRIASSKTR